MTNKPKTDLIPINNTPEYDETDKAILKAAALQPTKAIHAIAKDLVKVGIINNVQLVYDRLKRKDYLSRAFEEIQQHHREEWSRELMPLATKRARKSLKSLSDKDVVPLIQLTAKTVMGDQGADTKPTMINIENLERMQVIMKGNSRGNSQEP